MKFFLLFLTLFSSLVAEISKQGLAPKYDPKCIRLMHYFLPYNPNVVIVSESVVEPLKQLLQFYDFGEIYCFCHIKEELNQAQTNSPLVHLTFGLLYMSDGRTHFFPRQGNILDVPGSPLFPHRNYISYLHTSPVSIPTVDLKTLAKSKNLKQVDLFYLDAGGIELNILKREPHLLNSTILVYTKTYHKMIREKLVLFDELHAHMIANDFVLLTHHIKDGLVGEALYVKKKYYQSIFERHRF
jgi:hypothetical protein